MEPILFILKILPFLLKGVKITLIVSFISFAIGFVLGIMAGIARLSDNRLIYSLSSTYVEIIRGTPLLVQILFIYFGLPRLGINLDPLTAGIVALSINSGAYQAEIVRAGIQSIPRGQVEAALSLGMKEWQVFRYVILPQAVRNMVPALVNELVTLIKDSSLVSVIGVAELTRRGEYVVAWSFRPFETYLAVALIYFIICFTSSKISRYLEERFAIPGMMRRGSRWL
ncbi:MAG: nickel transporter [Thermoprotei archaeon]|nr:MAG: nickel transporter [Thermoprotei archaeon]